VALMWFWFVAGIAYIIIGIFSYISAMRLRLIDTQSPSKLFTDYWSDEDIEKMKREGGPVFLEQKRLFNERKISQQEWNHAIAVYAVPYHLETRMKVAKNSNDAAKVNRGILYAAAASFFIAAVFSFVQGYLIYIG
jgi:hypothetical protein